LKRWRGAAGRARRRASLLDALWRSRESRVVKAVALLLAVLLLSFARPAPILAGEVRLPSSDEIQRQFPEGGKLTGHEIYQRFLRNRFRSTLQRLTIISSDPAGNQQAMQMLARWKDYRADGADGAVGAVGAVGADGADGVNGVAALAVDSVPADGVIAKTLVRLEKPYDMRRTSYLLVVRRGLPHEQFVYQPSTRRVRRIWLRGIGLLGTDYTLDDLVFQTVEDATYERLPDGEVDGFPTYVVRARMKSFLDTRWEWVTTYLDKEHYILLRALYEDDSGTVRRELRADLDSIDEFQGVWLATRSTMYNRAEGTSSTLIVHHLLPDAELDDRVFSSFRMGTGQN
jgi:hypothetical protein